MQVGLRDYQLLAQNMKIFILKVFMFDDELENHFKLKFEAIRGWR